MEWGFTWSYGFMFWNQVKGKKEPTVIYEVDVEVGLASLSIQLHWEHNYQRDQVISTFPHINPAVPGDWSRLAGQPGWFVANEHQQANPARKADSGPQLHQTDFQVDNIEQWGEFQQIQTQFLDVLVARFFVD